MKETLNVGESPVSPRTETLPAKQVSFTLRGGKGGGKGSTSPRQQNAPNAFLRVQQAKTVPGRDALRFLSQLLTCKDANGRAKLQHGLVQAILSMDAAAEAGERLRLLHEHDGTTALLKLLTENGIDAAYTDGADTITLADLGGDDEQERAS